MEKARHFLRPILFTLLILALVLCFLASLQNLGSGHAREGRQQLEIALRRGAVACYAAEGIYPPNLEYLQAHYGVQIDTQRYQVLYEIFADNLMPEITVLERQQG